VREAEPLRQRYDGSRPLQPNAAGGPPTVPQALNRYAATPLGQPGVAQAASAALFVGAPFEQPVHRIATAVSQSSPTALALRDAATQAALGYVAGEAIETTASGSLTVIISKQSGVSEVLLHALKVDFWDVDEIANKIAAVLKYPPLQMTLRSHGNFEVRRLRWKDAAAKCIKIYEEMLVPV